MIPEILRFPLLCLAAYAVGCLSSGYYLVRILRGTDIRDHGSGSSGARNAGRLLGPWGFAAVSALDALKGILFMAFARVWIGDPHLLPWFSPFLVAGHIRPAHLGFRGGRGLMPILGTMVGIDFRFAPVAALAYFAPRMAARIARAPGGHPAPRALSLVLPMALLPFLPFPAWSASQAAALSCSSILVLWAHRSRIAPVTATPE